MTLYVLDTDILTLLQQNHPRVNQQWASHIQDDVCVTILSVEEQLSGWYTELRRAKKPFDLANIYDRLAVTVRMLSGLPILSFGMPAMQRYQALQALKLGVKKTDLRIAAVALEHSGILVSRNLRDFQRIPGLIIEDWSV